MEFCYTWGSGPYSVIIKEASPGSTGEQMQRLTDRRYVERESKSKASVISFPSELSESCGRRAGKIVRATRNGRHQENRSSESAETHVISQRTTQRALGPHGLAQVLCTRGIEFSLVFSQTSGCEPKRVSDSGPVLGSCSFLLLGFCVQLESESFCSVLLYFIFKESSLTL